MGYDETDSPRRDRGRDRQPVKRMGDREIPYRRKGEPGHKESGLNLITDSFRDQGRRQPGAGRRGPENGKPPGRRRGSVDIQVSGPGRENARGAGGRGTAMDAPGPERYDRSANAWGPERYGISADPPGISVDPQLCGRRRGLSDAQAPGRRRAMAGPSVSSKSSLAEGPLIMSGRKTLHGPGQEERSYHGPNGARAAARQSAAAHTPPPVRRASPERGGTEDSSYESIYEDPARRRAKKRKRKIHIILLEAVIFLGVMVFAGYSYINSRLSMMQQLPWDPEEIRNVDISEAKQEQMRGYWTVAIFGVDSRNASVGKGNNSDVNIICNINQDTGEIRLVSVFRDSYLNVSDKNSYNKINTAYLRGGPEQAVKALNKNLDLDIDDYATFNWKAVADAINILGGIDLEISEPEFYYINAFISETVTATGVGSNQLKHAGMNHLDGVQAVAYGRLRLMDTDFARTERQRKVIALAFEKAKQADWATINNIIQTVFPQVATSVDMGDILSMGRGITKYHLTETMGFPSARGDAKIKSKGACVIPQTLESNVVELHKFLFGDEDYRPTETVKSISQKIIADTGLSTNAKSSGDVGTKGGSVPRTTAADSRKESVSEEERGRTDREETDARGDGSDEAERETDSGGNLILPPGGYETGGAGNRTQQSQTEENGVKATAPYSPSREQEEAPGAPGGAGTYPGVQSDTGVIIAPGGVLPDQEPSGNVRPGQNASGSIRPGQEPSEAIRPGQNTTENARPGQDAPGSARPGQEQEQPTQGRVEFYGPPGT